jgi:hypothetical protein
MKASDPRVTSTVALVALTVWIGGLLTLGAIVAPIVFSAVPFQTAADTMTVVFSRFDKVAMGAAAVVLGTEAMRAHVEQREAGMTTGHVVRLVVSLVLAAMAVAEGLWVTPEIAGLHAEGAVRGVGEAGMRLATLHSAAEHLGQAQALLAVVLIALHFTTLPAPVVAREEPAESEG